MSEKRSSDIVSKSIAEASSLKELALDAAKKELLEQLTPGIRKMIARELGAQNTLSEDQDRMRRHADGYGETEFEEGTDKMAADDKDLDMESIAGMFPSISEADGDEDMDDMAEARDDEEPDGDECPVEEGDIPTLGEADDYVDEDISISEAELDRVYGESLALEMQMSKGFKDIPQPADEVDVNSGLHDVKNGEHPWEDQEPPAKKDWTMKEMRLLAQKGLAENRRLEGVASKLHKENRALREHLSKMNLFNQKILHVNKFFVEHRLSDKQKHAVVESFDRARSLDECKNTYKTLKSTFRASGVVSESKSQSQNKPKANSQRPRKPGANEKVIRESVDKSANGENAQYSRWQKLSGLKEIK